MTAVGENRNNTVWYSYSFEWVDQIQTNKIWDGKSIWIWIWKSMFMLDNVGHFTNAEVQHPIYRSSFELGKVRLTLVVIVCSAGV